MHRISFGRTRCGSKVRRTRLIGLERMEPRVLLSTYTVVNTTDADPGSLRWAILQANQGTGPCSILFDLPGPGVQTISVQSPLPTITRPVVIDGTSGPGYTGQLRIQVDGRATAGADGLVLAGGSSHVKGLVISRFQGAGIVLQGGGGNVVQGNALGTDRTGMAALPNRDGVLVVGSSANTIGGMLAGEGNLISGNSANGIEIQLDSQNLDSAGNVILGNLIGTTSDGSSALANAGDGILINRATRNIIGGPDSGAGNVISGNLNGLEINSSAELTLIQGNLIGTTADGRNALGNRRDGIFLDGSSSNTIGGANASSGNVIAGNFGHGVDTARGASGNAFQGNFIGTDRQGTLHLGNQGNGVNLGSSDNTVGGLSSGSGNTIAFNGSGVIGAGVQLVGLVDRNSILSNSIHDNAGLGINVGNGPTPNHPPDSGPGPNDFVNYPVFSSAQTDGTTTTLHGSVSGAPGTSLTVQVFSSPTPDPSGFGEGLSLVGNFQTSTDSRGQGSFDLGLPPSGPGSYISATATDGAGNTSEFSPVVAARAVTDLEVTISVTPDPIAAGGSLTYSITVRNVGILDAHNVILTETLPGQVTLLSATSSQGRTPFVSGQGISAALGTVPGGASASVTVIVQVQAHAGQSLSASAQATLDELDANPADNSATATTRVATVSDLAVSLAVSPGPVELGSDLTFTVTAVNTGPSPASHVTVTLPLPPALAFRSAITTQGAASFADGHLTANLGSLDPGSQVTITVIAGAVATGRVSTTATISSDAFDPEAANNTATAQVNVAPIADLAVAIHATSGPVADGQQVVYTVVASNVGNSLATGVSLVNVLPAGVMFVSASIDHGNIPTRLAGAITSLIGQLAPGATSTLTITAQVTGPAGTSLVDTAQLSATEHDPTPADNWATATMLVRDPSELSVTLNPASSSVALGQRLEYTLVVTNSGPADEPDGRLTISLPSSVALVTFSAPSGAAVVQDESQLSVDLGPLAAAESETISFIILPRPAAVGLLTLSASVQGENVNLDPAGARATATVVVTPAAGLSIAIQPPDGSAHQGQDLAYTLVVDNGGPSGDTNVVATAPLPAGVDFVSASGSGVQADFQSGVVTAVFGTVLLGQTATVTIVVRPSIAAPAPGLVLAASVVGDAFDADTADNSASVIVPVDPSVDLGVQLSSAQVGSFAGQPLTLTATVWNSGPSEAKNVALQLPLGSSARFVSSTGAGSTQLQAGSLLADVGSLPAGTNATLTITFLPQSAGPLSFTADISGDQFDLDPADNESVLTVQVAEPPGTLAFASPVVSVAETAGYADVPVVRTLGSLGPVTVHFHTSGGNATPGVDYQPVSGILAFASGETTKTIRLPVIANSHDNHDEFVSLVLDSPGGALLGPVTSTVVQIRDVDPDLTPPVVADLSWSGSASSITSLVVRFSEPVVSASVQGVFQILDLGTSGMPTAAGSQVAIGAVMASGPEGSTFTIVPAQPLLAGHFYRVVVSGAGATAVLDQAGNRLAGAGPGQSGTDYVALIGRGTTLRYYDDTGDLVTLKVTGGGYLDEIRGPRGEGQVLRLEDAVAHKTVLSGSVARAKGRGAGTTSLGTIEGLGQFGDVRVTLSSPTFTVRQYPFFLRRGRQLTTTSRPTPVKRTPAPALKHVSGRRPAAPEAKVSPLARV